VAEKVVKNVSGLLSSHLVLASAGWVLPMDDVREGVADKAIIAHLHSFGELSLT
jgi:hypothetical protein